MHGRCERIRCRNKYRRELGIPDNAVVLLTVGALESRKNQIIFIKTLSKIRNSNIYLLICSEGIMTNRLHELSKALNIEKNVLFLGRRTDICHMAYIFCFPSKREGMEIAALEAIAAGLPSITSNIQGTKDFLRMEKQDITWNMMTWMVLLRQ